MFLLNYFEEVNIQFAFQLLVCYVAFLIGKKKRKRFLIRAVCSVSLFIVVAHFWDRLFEPLNEVSLLLIIIYFIGYILLSVVPLLCCYELSPAEIIIVITGGYATEHIAYASGRIIQYLAAPYSFMQNDVLRVILFLYLIYFIAATLAYFLIVHKNEKKIELIERDVRLLFLALVVLLSAVILSVISTASSQDYTLPISEIVCPLYSILCCTMVLLLEYNILRDNKAKHERLMMEQLLHMAHNQQQNAKEAIDIINIKCHDLKHQVKVLAGIQGDKVRAEYMKEVQDAVSIYDAGYQTGCEALDYILCEKALLAHKNEIQFSCMADGSALDFLSPPDLYALIGNALDNALECSVQEPVAHRYISMQVRQHGDMIMIHIENYCSVVPEFKDGIPITKKEDHAVHGFGVKSMKYIVEKYNGELLMRAQNERFSLDILFRRSVREN